MDKKEQILEAAKKLMSEKGFDATTVRDISKTADVNVAMISYYFGSKEKLFAAMIEENAAQMYSKLEYIGNTGAQPEKKIEALVTLYVENILNNQSFFNIINRELTMGHSEELNHHIITVHTKNFNSFKKIIIEGQKQNIFRENIDLDLTMATFFGTITEVTNPGKLLYNMYKVKFSGNKNDQVKDDALKVLLKTHLVNLLNSFLMKKQLA
jgi:AcrR family transcriptional regulator